MTGQDADSPWASPATETEVQGGTEIAPRAGSPAASGIQAPTGIQTGTGPARSMRPRLVKAALLAAAVLAAVATAIAVAHRGGLDPAATTPPPTTAPPASGYEAPGDLCQQADFTRLRPTFNRIGDLYRHGSKVPTLEIAACDGTTGNQDVTGLFAFEVQVSTRPDELAAVFDAQRASVAARVPVTDIAGLGNRAYEYVAAGQTGLTVELYDDNLVMRLSWSTMRAGDQAPAGLDTALVETCRSTLRLLRVG